MNQIKKLNTTISGLVLAALLSLSFIYALTSSLHFKYSPANILVISSVMLLLYTAAFWNKFTRRVLIGLIIAAVLFALFYVTRKGLVARYIYATEDFLYWLSDYMLGNVSLNAVYETYTTYMLCFIITLPVFFLTLKHFSFPIVLLGGASIFVTQWTFEFFVSFGAFYLFTFVILVYYMQHIYLKKYSREQGEFLSPGSFVIYVIPVCAIVFILSFIIPVSSRPIEWKWMDNKVISMARFFKTEYSNSFSKFDYFSIEYTGFGRSGKLGGKVKLDNTAVLEVIGDKPVYLKASGKDTYTGTAWVDTDKASTAVDSIDSRLRRDILEVSIGIPLLSDSNVGSDRIFAINEYDIKFLDLKTKSIFLPQLTQQIGFMTDQDLKITINGNNTIIMDRAMSKDFGYKTVGILADYGNEKLKNILRKSRKGLYEDILSKRLDSDAFRVVSRVNPVVASGGRDQSIRYVEFIQELAHTSKEIHDKYTQMPDTVPQRVKDLAVEITASQTSCYDKVKSIESYLSTNFPYTLNAKSTPRGRDFVDYFLFDSKQGYCTYYASAMAIMARSIGIPARYVEGYMMPVTPESEDTYIVTNENAHAWVEVYFEGYGWVPFEPTAAYTYGFYSGNAPEQQETRMPEETPQPEIESSPVPEKNTNDDMPENSTDDTIEYEKGSNGSGFILLLITPVVVLSILVIFNIMRRRKSLSSIIRMAPRESVLAFYRHFIHLLKLQGYSINEGETASQYSERIDRVVLLRPVCFKDITEVFMIARYSLNDINEDIKKSYQEFYGCLVESTKKEIGKFKFYFYRYILGII